MPDLTNTIKIIINITQNGQVKQVTSFVERTASVASFDINLDEEKK